MKASVKPWGFHFAGACPSGTQFCNPDMTPRDQIAWLGMKDSNSEMSSQIIPLKARTDFQESGRILAIETIRV